MQIEWGQVSTWVYGAVVGLIGLIASLIRTILTSKTKIDLLEQRLSDFEEMQTEMRTDIKLLLRSR